MMPPLPKEILLTEHSQEVISQLNGGLTITTYVNLLDDNNIYWGVPSAYKSDQQNFRHYTRFKPEIEMKDVFIMIASWRGTESVYAD